MDERMAILRYIWIEHGNKLAIAIVCVVVIALAAKGIFKNSKES